MPIASSSRTSRVLAALLAPTLVGLLALLLVPNARFFEDDFIQIGTLEGRVEGHGRPPFDLYRFLDGSEEQVAAAKSRGPLPWFTHEQAQVHFARPLASALLTVEHRLWGRHPEGYLATSLLCYLLLVLLVAALPRAALPRDPQVARVVGLWATPLFVACSFHWYVVAYTAARWALLAALFGLAALVAHLRWRLGGWRPGRPLAWLALLASLGSGELGLALGGFLVAFELVAGPGGRGAKLRALWPFALTAGAYLVAYRIAGFGSFATGSYVDPIREPLAFCLALPQHLLALAGELLLGVPALALQAPGAVAWLPVAAGLLGCALLALPVTLLRGHWSSERAAFAGWLALGTLLAALPVAAALPQSRLLLPLSLGSVPLLALAAHGFWNLLRPSPGLRRWIAGAALLLLCALLLGLGPWRWVSTSRGAAWGADHWLARVRAAAWLDDSGTTRRTIFLTPDLRDRLHGLYARRFVGATAPESYWILSTADAIHLYRRVDEHTLELELRRGRLLATAPERQLRPRAFPLRPGDRTRLDGLLVEVLEAPQGEPTRLRFRFVEQLDDPALRFLARIDGELRAVAPPEPGSTLQLPSPW